MCSEVTNMHCHELTRRDWLLKTSAAAGAWLAGPSLSRAAAPTSPVAVARCRTYDQAELLPVMQKTVRPAGRTGQAGQGQNRGHQDQSDRLTHLSAWDYLPLEDTHYTHPHVIAAAVHLMGKAGARRIRILESPWSTADPVEEYILRANWEPRDILGAAPNVEFENTNYLGRAKKYSRMTVPFGGYIFPAFDLNHSYEDCDVFVSIAKMKEHATAGVTLSMKNCFGITPCTIYGTGAGVDEPSEIPKGGRSTGPFRRSPALQKRAAGEGSHHAARRTRSACRAPWWI